MKSLAYLLQASQAMAKCVEKWRNLDNSGFCNVTDPPGSDSFPAISEEDIFAEMEPFTVKAGGADDSRESLYTRLEGE